MSARRVFQHAGNAFELVRIGSEAVQPSVQMIFLHALLANRASFAPFVRHVSKSLTRVGIAADAVLIDARNHGDSVHTELHAPALLCDDVVAVLGSQHAARAPALPRVLCGHSMGGKTALRLALLEPHLFAGLVSLDAAPAAYAHSHAHIFRAMRAVDFGKALTKAAVDSQLAVHLPSVTDRQFVISNNLAPIAPTPLLVPSIDAASPVFRWRANLDALDQGGGAAAILAWDVAAAAVSAVPTLFIGGSESVRLTDAHYVARARAHFSNARLEIVAQAGHFVHMSAPTVCADLLAKFVEQMVTGRPAL